MSDVVALLPAAGRARRLGELSGSKEVLPLGPTDGGPQTTFDHLLDRLAQAGIARAVVVLRSGKWDIPKRLARRQQGPTVVYRVIESSDSVPETLTAGLEAIGSGPVLLAFPDILYEPAEVFRQAIDEQAQGADLVLGLFPTPRADKSDMVELDASGRPIDIVIKDPHCRLNWAWGFAVWGSRFSELVTSAVGAASHAGEHELYIGDLVRSAIGQGFDVRAVSAPEGLFLDIGTPEDLERAKKYLTARASSQSRPTA